MPLIQATPAIGNANHPGQPHENGYYSPWGRVEHITVVDDGIVFASTSSHGGYWLSQERWKELTARFPAFKPFANSGVGWLEEDCDWRFACFAWPELFPADALEAAHRIEKWYASKR